jgi:hypothetical protein
MVALYLHRAPWSLSGSFVVAVYEIITRKEFVSDNLEITALLCQELPEDPDPYLLVFIGDPFKVPCEN